MSAAKTGHRGDHPLRIAVLIKQVPMGEFGATEDGRLRRAGVAAEINPYCRRALAKGIELARVSNGYCVAIAMGPPEAEAALREAVLCGADDAVLLSDRRLAGADSLATALALAAYIRQQEPFDLIITGLHSVDADTGQVGPQMAELLSLPFVAGVHDLAIEGRSLSMRCEHDDRTVIVTAELPAILSAAERLCAPAKAKLDQWAPHSHGARIRVVGADELGAGPWGQAASPTRVRTLRRIDHLRLGLLLNGDPPAQARRLVDELRQRGTLAELARRWAAASVEGALPGAAAGTRRPPTGPEIVVILEPGRDRLARELLGEAMRLSGLVGGRVVAAAEVSSAVAQFADEALLLRPAVRTDLDEEQTAHALAGILASREVWAVLTGSTSWGRHVAGRLAAALGAGLIGDAVELTVVEQRLMAWKPAFGDTVHAGIDCATLPQMATIRPGALPLAALAAVPAVTTVVKVGTATRVHRAEVVVDGAADLVVSTPVLIGVGSGVDPMDYPLLAPIADLLSAQLVATRKVTDAGWLPRSRQVGLTGRHVAPILYLAVGMKGSPNHMVGVRNAGTVVAVNIDVGAQVLRAADYGLIGDWRSVIAELTTALSGVYTARPAQVDSAHSSAAPS